MDNNDASFIEYIVRRQKKNFNYRAATSIRSSSVWRNQLLVEHCIVPNDSNSKGTWSTRSRKLFNPPTRRRRRTAECSPENYTRSSPFSYPEDRASVPADSTERRERRASDCRRHMAAGSSEAGRLPSSTTPGCLKRCPAGERDSFESRRVANRYSECTGRGGCGGWREAGRHRPPAAVMYLNGLCPSAFARRHYDARAMDTVQMDTLTPDGRMDEFRVARGRRTYSDRLHSLRANRQCSCVWTGALKLHYWTMTDAFYH